MKKAVFFDRDGTLTHTVLRKNSNSYFDNWPRDISELKIVEKAAEVVNYAKLNGYLPLSITNQRGIYDGALTLVQYEEITKKICEELSMSRSQVLECLHGRAANCFCRKPKPGLFLMAKGLYDIDLPNSVMVGDSLTDIQAAYAAGIQNAIFIKRPEIANVQVGNKKDELELIEFTERSHFKPKIINSLDEVISLDLFKKTD